MIGVARGVTVFAHAKPCDMHKQFDTPSAIATETLRRNVLAGDLYS